MDLRPGMAADSLRDTLKVVQQARHRTCDLDISHDEWRAIMDPLYVAEDQIFRAMRALKAATGDPSHLNLVGTELEFIEFDMPDCN